jgi:hypothetical protein
LEATSSLLAGKFTPAGIAGVDPSRCCLFPFASSLVEGHHLLHLSTRRDECQTLGRSAVPGPCAHPEDVQHPVDSPLSELPDVRGSHPQRAVGFENPRGHMELSDLDSRSFPEPIERTESLRLTLRFHCPLNGNDAGQLEVMTSTLCSAAWSGMYPESSASPFGSVEISNPSNHSDQHRSRCPFTRTPPASAS